MALTLPGWQATAMAFESDTGMMMVPRRHAHAGLLTLQYVILRTGKEISNMAQSPDRPARKPKPRVKLKYVPTLHHDVPVAAGGVFTRLLADTVPDRRTGIAKQRSNLAWQHLANFLAAKAFASEPPPDRKGRKERQH